MNTLKIVWKNISKQLGSTILSIILTAFGAAILCVLYVTGDSFEKQLDSNSKNIDLVVGAKGSPLQLILSAVYHVDNPTGNISLAEANQLKENPFVKLAVPLSLGDNYKGHRIVGTNTDFLKLYETTVAEGKYFYKPFEVVIGHAVAQKHQLKIGSKINSSHGLSASGEDHHDHPFVVVGILKKNDNITDNLILCSLESVWDVHGLAHGQASDDHHHAEEDLQEQVEAHLHHHGETEEEESRDHPHEEYVKNIGQDLIKDQGEEITAMLIQYQSPAAIAMLPKLINQSTAMQAASPAIESARLFSLLGVGIDSLTILAYIIMLMAGLSVFLSLYNALKQRKYDLAVMRTLGASKARLFAMVLLEGLIITLLGGLVGMLLGHIALFYISTQTSQSAGLIEVFSINPDEWWILLIACVIGVLSALIPSVKAYNTTISNTLSNN
ncbi:ABC transporter permease [Sphingobacterium spiritivorum]|uniref:ABC transporter permease n=1 Tax=Sphingobacterium spiritivorum TaxID=258 RepID=UPI003DA69C04